MISRRYFFFFFNDTATTEIYTLSLHDALPILDDHPVALAHPLRYQHARETGHRIAELAIRERLDRDRKSTRLNSSHSQISYAVFCLKKTTVDATDSAPRT